MIKGDLARFRPISSVRIGIKYSIILLTSVKRKTSITLTIGDNTMKNIETLIDVGYAILLISWIVFGFQVISGGP